VQRWPKDAGHRAELGGLAQSSARQNEHARPSNQPEPNTERHHKPSCPVVMIIECCATKNQNMCPEKKTPDLQGKKAAHVPAQVSPGRGFREGLCSPGGQRKAGFPQLHWRGRAA
jgi:hypothetical protein